MYCSPSPQIFYCCGCGSRHQGVNAHQMPGSSRDNCVEDQISAVVTLAGEEPNYAKRREAKGMLTFNSTKIWKV